MERGPRWPLWILGLLLCSQAWGDAIVDRFQLLEDRFQAQDIFAPFDDDVVFDLSAAANRNFFDVVDEAKEAADKNLSNEEKLKRAQDFLKKHNNSEQFIRGHFKFGVPLPSFDLFKLKMTPSFRLSAGMGILLNLRGERATPSNISEFLPRHVPTILKDKLMEHFDDIPVGADIVQWLIDNDSEVARHPGARLFVGAYFMPEKDVETALVEHYIKTEARSGFYVNYRANDRWDGHFNLYALGRADFGIKADAQTIYQNSKILTDLPDDLNTTVYAMADYHLRYTNKNLHLLMGVEEIEMAQISDNEEKGGVLRFDRGPLLRVHGDYTYRSDNIHLSPFVGVHKRAGYGFDDGSYLGAEVGTKVKSDRIGLYFRGQWDKEYFTFSPHMRLFFMRLGYLLKQPATSKRDGTKLAAMHAVHFRLFF